jgi:hypothetical protein
MTPILPADVARCVGLIVQAHGFRRHEQCRDCLRRTALPPDPNRICWIGPPRFVDDKCPNQIVPSNCERQGA